MSVYTTYLRRSEALELLLIHVLTDIEGCWDEIGPYVSFFFFLRVYILNIYYFLATIIVFKKIGTTTNRAPNATNTSRPRDLSQVPSVHFILFLFYFHFTNKYPKLRVKSISPQPQSQLEMHIGQSRLQLNNL